MHSKPWYLSETILGSLLVIVSTSLRVSGYELGDLPGWSADLSALIGAILAIHGRIRAVTRIRAR